MHVVTSSLNVGCFGFQQELLLFTEIYLGFFFFLPKLYHSDVLFLVVILIDK